MDLFVGLFRVVMEVVLIIVGEYLFLWWVFGREFLSLLRLIYYYCMILFWCLFGLVLYFRRKMFVIVFYVGLRFLVLVFCVV